MNKALLVFRLKMALAIIAILLLGAAFTYGIMTWLFGPISGVALVTSLVLMAFFLTLFQWLIGPFLINAMYRLMRLSLTIQPTAGSTTWLLTLQGPMALRMCLRST